MKLDGIKNRKEYISKALFAVSVVLAVLTAGKVLSFAFSSIRTGGRIEAAVAKNGQNDEAVKACIAANRAAADKIKERNMFAEPKAKPNPPTCIAILGSKALINDKWYGVGDEVVGAKIVAIGPKDVTILWEEKEKKLIPFEATVKEGSHRPPSAPPEKSEGAEERRPSPAPSAEERRGERPFGRRGRGRFFENMSEDQRREMRERMRNMSREERRQFFEERRGEIESEQN